MSIRETTICLLHAYGQSTFTKEEIKDYGSLENLMASEILQEIPNREKSLTQLWEAAHIDLTDEPSDEEPTQTEEQTT